MEREEYIKSHNLDEISLILTSFKEKGLVGINYMALHEASYVVISTSSSFEKSDILKPQEEFFKLDGDKIKKENNPFYEIGMFSCKVDFACDKYSSNKFYYYVVGRGYKSTVHSFEIDSNKDDYYFYSFVDLQHGFNNLTHPLIKKIKEIKYAPLMLNSGDLSAVSADYNEWKWMVNGGLFDDVLFNSAVGDHEYWADYNVHASLMAEPYPFMYCMNNPLNGPLKEKGKSYYFLYNNALFVFINSQDSDTVENENIENIIKWFDEVVEENKGKYDYLFVYMHKAIYGSFDNDTRVRRIMKNYFYPIFDKARVDVVFSGHDHRYSRSYPIKREKIDEDGVIYFDMGSSGNKWRSFEENVLSDGLHASVLKIKEEAMTLGAICHVKKDEFSLNVYDINGNIQDSFSFKKKKR